MVMVADLPNQEAVVQAGTKLPGKMPTLVEILSKFNSGVTYFRAFHQQCKLEEDYYFGRREVPVPVDMPIDPVRPATGRAIVNIATDHVDTENLSIEIPLMPRSRARAEKMKKFYYGAWLSIDGPVLETAVKQAFLYGLSFFKPGFEASLWPDRPKITDFARVDSQTGEIVWQNESGYKEALKEFLERRNATFPFHVENVNPQQVVWDDSPGGPRWAIRFVKSTVADIQRMYPQWQTDKAGNSPMVWMEYWDEFYFSYLAGNDFILPPEPHGYGFQPLIPLDTANTPNWTMAKPEERWQGILNPVHNLLDEEARLVTQISSIIRKFAWPGLDFSGGSEQARQNTSEVYEFFAGKNLMATGVEVNLSPMLQLPPDLTGHLAVIQSLIEEATFPNVIRGVRPTGVSSGFAISVLAGVGRLVLRSVAKGTARAIEKVNSAFAMLVENVVRQPVTVHARSEIHSFDQTIAPDDIRGYTENIVDLKAEAPEEREREALLALKLFQATLISRATGMKRAGITNPIEEEDQRAAELLLDELRPEQADELKRRLGQGLPAGESTGSLAAVNIGNQFLPGQSQLQRPGERNIQQARSASQAGRPSVFPQGLGGLANLGGRIGSPTGGAVGVPSGQTVR